MNLHLELIGLFIKIQDFIKLQKELLRQNILDIIRLLQRSKHPYISNYSSEYSKYNSENTSTPEEEYYQSIIYVPLKVKDKKIGVLTIKNINSNAFSDIDSKTIENIALYASVTIEN